MYFLTIIIIIIITSLLWMYSRAIYDNFDTPPRVCNILSTDKVHTPPNSIPNISSPTRVGIYVITYNCPKQFRELLKSLESNDFLKQSHSRIVLNNSTDRTTDDMYAKLCAKYNFTEIKKDNIGITCVLKFLARHFVDDPELTH
jgi:cellulose synthase/poly-beta-1,6-N-acetylglucosamine synthase-like glycosyltransferase